MTRLSMASLRSLRGACSFGQAAISDDGPSTSGRGAVCHRRIRLIVRANMPEMYATNPFPVRPTADGVVKGVRTPATPRLSPDRVMQLLAETKHATAQRDFGAFYSSELGGIVTEPGFMVVHIDDHMVHRGDAVFDHVVLADGYLYQLDEHIERFKQSAELAGLPLLIPEERLKRILLDTAAASLKMNGMVTFWLSRGRGTFGLVDTEGPSLYAICSSEIASAVDTVDRDTGLRAVVSPVDPKSYYFTAMKNVSYINNAVAKLEAMSRGADVAVFVDDEQKVLYGPDCSIGIFTRDNVLVIPPDEGGLAGMAARNVAELCMPYKEIDEDGEENLPVERVERRLFTVQEMKDAQEAFAMNTFYGVVGISHLDEHWIGDDEEFMDKCGPVSLALNEMLLVDRKHKKGSLKHTEVPYGFMTGMLSQLL